MDDHSRLFPDYFGSPNPKKSSCRPENELLELLWQNGTVVKQTQGIRRPQYEPVLQPESNESGPSNQSDPIQEDPSWFQYPFEDSLEKDLYQEYFSEIPNFGTTVGVNSAVENNAGHTNVMDYTNFSHFSRPVGKVKETQHNNKVRSEFGESSKLSSSYCTSNQEQATVEHGPPWFSETETTRVSSERMYTSTNEMTATSSSGGSGGNFGKIGDQNTNYSQQITKAKEGENSESHSEDADDNKAMKPGKSINKRTSKRRSRAAEVHNLSERRRRDRINEKMRALQELIPHCNKTDKASILDEAIEYLKSLQMQVQLMWMGGGAPPMYPGINPLMACMGPVNPSNVPHQMPGLVHMPRVPFINPSLATLNPMSNHLPQFVAAPAMNPASNIHAQMQGIHIAQQRVQQAAQVANANASGTNVAQSIQLSGPTTGSMILPNSREFSTDAEKK